MKKILLALPLIFLLGCKSTNTVYAPGKVPTLDAAEKPELEKLTPEEVKSYLSLDEVIRRKLEASDKKLKIYGEQNDAVIKEYNAFAKYRNAMSEEFLTGKKPEKEQK